MSEPARGAPPPSDPSLSFAEVSDVLLEEAVGGVLWEGQAPAASASGENDEELAARLEAAIGDEARRAFADAAVTVDVRHASTRGASWVPLWKSLECVAVVDLSVTTPVARGADYTCRLRGSMSILGACSSRMARSRLFEKVVDHFAKTAPPSIRSQLER